MNERDEGDKGTKVDFEGNGVTLGTCSYMTHRSASCPRGVSFLSGNQGEGAAFGEHGDGSGGD